jgi:hypothetical protein
MWPTTVVQGLFEVLPEGYTSGPMIQPEPPYSVGPPPAASWPAPPPTFAANWPVPDSYEVQVWDRRHFPRVVAAVEFVVPGNKDEIGGRRFAARVGEWLRQDAAVVVVDVVTTEERTLFAELFGHVGVPPPVPAAPLAAAALRVVRPPRGEARLDVWFHPLELGRRLPTLPLWLAEDIAVPLDLDPPYEDACRVLHIA